MKEIELSKQLPVVTMNFEEVKASLIETTEKYKNFIVTEEGLKDCKATQKELAAVRNKIDTYRKEIKKEMEQPIKAFEVQCKELIGLIADAEQPIKDGILVFDDKKREEKRLKAEELIVQAVAEYGLNEEYAKQLTVLDKYMNLSGTNKAVVEDIEVRALSLQKEQLADTERVQIVADTIENVNKNIDAKLCVEDFQNLLDTKASTVKIIQDINARADRIKASEEKAIADRKAKAEKEVLERIAAAEREVLARAAAERQALAKAAAEKVEPTPVKEPVIIQPEPIQRPHVTTKAEPLRFINMKVTGTKSDLMVLSGYLKASGYNYEVIEQGMVE